MNGISPKFQEIISEFRDIIGDTLELISVFTPDGITLYSEMPKGVAEEFFVASCSAIVEIGKAVLSQSSLGENPRIVLEGESGFITLDIITRDLYLMMGFHELEYSHIREKIDNFIESLKQFFSK